MTKTFKQLRKDKLNEQHFSHVGQNVSQKLSYDNWLKKVKGIEKGAHGIKGDEHTKFSKQWKDYRGKDKLAASYEQVELKEARYEDGVTLPAPGYLKAPPPEKPNDKDFQHFGSSEISAFKKKRDEFRRKGYASVIVPADSKNPNAKSASGQKMYTLMTDPFLKHTQHKGKKGLFEQVKLGEVSPPGWGGSVKAMKKHADIDNPYALAWHMKNKGDKPHYKDKDGTPVKKDKYKDEQMEQVTEKLDVKWDKDKEGWFDKQGKRRYLGKGATTDLMRKAIDKAKASGDWIKPFDLQHGQRPEEKEIEMKKENKYFDTKSGSIEDSIKQMYQLESTEVTVNRKELDKLVKQYIAKGGTVTKLPPALKPGEDPDPERKAYKVKKVGNTYKILKASLREFVKTYNEHFLTNYAAEEFIEDMQHGYDSQGKSLAPVAASKKEKEKEEGAMKRGKHLDTYKPKPKDK